MHNYSTNRSLTSSISPNATGLGDSIVTSPIEAYISRIKVNFGKISQNDANFAARVHSLTAQKTKKNQKTTAICTSCGFIVPKKGD
jgi:hypothetical protein